MKKYRYKCTLLSDIIITSDASTEAPSDGLDYIPGSKFLGIVASHLYDESQVERTLDLFHNGVVRYGDASLFFENNNCFKAPFSWYYEKGKGVTDDIYLHHLLKTTDKQLKQVRSGYFSPATKSFINVERSFSLKSAHDADKRRSKDSQMFGYQSLKAGTEWVFEVSDDKGTYADEIKKILLGKHRIGRSRSAEYGLVEISFLEETAPNSIEATSEELIIYAKSNLCFIDEATGSYTAQPTTKQLCGDEKATILWDKCQVRSRNYKIWNRHRWNKDADRIIIERGSVFVLKTSENINTDFFTHEIGCHRNEGFGQVIVNPDFLKSRTETLDFTLKKRELLTYQKSFVKKGKSDEKTLVALQNIHQRDDFSFQIDKAVNQFKSGHWENFKGISKSQWGTLRNYGKHLNKRVDFMKLVFDKESGFLYTGQSEKEWRQKSRRTILEDHLKKIDENWFFPFVIKLSSQMSKRD